MSVSDTCCSRHPFESDYTPKGAKVSVNGMDVYVVGDQNDVTLMGVYDIFGFHNNTLQFCDALSNAGFRVVVPDFFYGKPWKAEDMGDRNKLISWIQDVGSWEKTRPNIVAVIDYVKQQYKCDAFGIFGFCWGGKVSVRAAQDLSLGFRAAALIHPSLHDDNDAKTVKVPLLVIPSKGEPDFGPFMDNLPLTVKEQSEHYRFDDMIHGFCGARGDLKDAHVLKRICEANTYTIQFFKKIFSKL